MNTSTSPNWLAFALNLVGGVVVGYSLIVDDTEGRPTWVLVVALVSVAAWIARGIVVLLSGAGRTAVALSVVAALAGGLVAAPTNGVAVVPAAVGVLAVVSSVGTPIVIGFGLSLVTIALIAVGAVPFGSSVAAVLAMMGGVLLAMFAGLSRRQFRQSEAQAAELREQEVALREEASRVAIARDLHDVLAHSLGGLVIQLDAVEALLESGDVGEAGRRVTDARGLAASGLSEARRAVAALRGPDGAPAGEPVSPDDFAASVAELLAAHRSLGAVADLTVAGEPVPLSDAQASALERALQEALSNARKHAPGEPIRVALDWLAPQRGQDGRVRLTVSNPLADGAHPSLGRTGGGHGLDGMRERFASLPLGGTASAGVRGDRFVVTAEAAL
ncbi:sensor histidine kinase [Leifsonia sp. NPDC058248]|uniref:sensor histidine kinase n=1 Tax=Leifsonia sp. NPDC058248 TaxID=3346402 RepID=UPI0036DA80C9